MKQYELSYLTAEEGDEGIPTQITEMGGRLINTGSLGRRKLAYPIKKQDFAVYHSVLFTADPSQIEKLKTGLTHNQKVIRSLLFERKIEALPTVKFDEELAESKEEELPARAIVEKEEKVLEKEEKTAIKPVRKARKKVPVSAEKPKSVKPAFAKATAGRPRKKVEKPRQVELDEKLRELLKE